MPPKFMSSSFDFTKGEDAPEHIEGYPCSEERDPTKIWLEGLDTFSHEYYPVAIDIDDAPTARVLQAARERQIARVQPNAGSIQDKTIVRHPVQN
ncbi:MAG TPA: hypothetical protein VIH90_07225 [Candidatus Saccharimonadales bacterium]